MKMEEKLLDYFIKEMEEIKSINKSLRTDCATAIRNERNHSEYCDAKLQSVKTELTALKDDKRKLEFENNATKRELKSLKIKLTKALKVIDAYKEKYGELTEEPGESEEATDDGQN